MKAKKPSPQPESEPADSVLPPPDPPSISLTALEQEIRAMDNGLFGPVGKPDNSESAEETLARCLAMMRHIKQRGIETGVLRF